MSVSTLLNEELIAICEIPRRLPRRIHLSTCHRWYKRGVRGRKLETVLVGGRRFTSAQALVRFVEAISNRESDPQLPTTAVPIHAAVIAAEREMQVR